MASRQRKPFRPVGTGPRQGAGTNPYKAAPAAVPGAIQRRNQGIKLILFGLPFVIIPGWVLYERFILHKERQRQTGEMMPDGTVREWLQWEIEERDDTWLTRIFGKG